MSHKVIARYTTDNTHYIVTDMIDDLMIEGPTIKGSRWFSTHAALTLKADVALALSTLVGHKVLQADVDYL